MTSTIFVGNVGQEPVYREINGFPHTTFNLARTPRIRNAQGEWVDGATTWIRVTTWRLLAEHVRDSVHRGDAVMVYGRLDTRRWFDENRVPHDELLLEAEHVGHDLRRGVSQFRRTGRSAPELAPRFETDAEAELAALEQAEEAAIRGEQEERAAEPVAVES